MFISPVGLRWAGQSPVIQSSQSIRFGHGDLTQTDQAILEQIQHWHTALKTGDTNTVFIDDNRVTLGRHDYNSVNLRGGDPTRRDYRFHVVMDTNNGHVSGAEQMINFAPAGVPLVREFSNVSRVVSDPAIVLHDRGVDDDRNTARMSQHPDVIAAARDFVQLLHLFIRSKQLDTVTREAD